MGKGGKTAGRRKEGSRLPAEKPEERKPKGFLPWLRRSWPSIVILAITFGIFVYLFETANQGRIFKNEIAREERTEVQNGETLVTTVERAKVVNISKDTVTVDRDNPDGREKGNQRLLVRLLSGAHKGEVRELSYEVMVGIYTNEKVRENDEITVLQTDNRTAGTYELVFRNYNRSTEVYIVLGLFLLVVILVGGRTGLKSLLGLAVTVTALIWIFCPLWMKGAQPVPLAFWLCVLVTVMSLVLLGGTDRKILCAILGTVAGMGLAALFALAAQSLCRIDSYSMIDAGAELAELVNLQTTYDVHIEGLLTAGVIIASLGAVMDVAMSLSSAIAELKSVNPGMRFPQLWRSAMHIGRDMVGTMTNTLVLAFVGSSLVLVLRLWMQGASYNALLSSRYLSVELIQAISSSVGVVLSVPLTAVIGAAFYGRAASKGGKA